MENNDDVVREFLDSAYDGLMHGFPSMDFFDGKFDSAYDDANDGANDASFDGNDRWYI